MDTLATVDQTLCTVFGFDKFMPGQHEVIERLIDGCSVLAVFPTGQGKSLCYQLPALHFSGLTLVVSPLVALMKDQVDFLAGKNIKAARLDSSLDRHEFDHVQADLMANRLKILYVAPERFANERFLSMLKRLSISMLVIDEAHCISEWGHNFRPDYLKLAQFRTDLQIPVVLALTATATPQVADDIRAAFAIGTENFVHTGFYRPNLCLRFSVSDNPLQLLLERLSARPQAATIVYVTLQATAEQVAGKLAAQGYPARAYHAGMKNEERHGVQDWFMASASAIVVATIAFGMGIDKSDIRYVYHYNLPKSLENYAQEIGRAGRDNKPAICEMLGSVNDLTVLENFVYGDTPEPTEIARMVGDILAQKNWFSLSIHETSRQYDMRALVVNTLLTYLELEDIIASTGPFYSSYKFVPHRSSAEIYSRFDPARAAFLRTVFSCARKGKKWFTLDLDEVVEKTVADRQRVVAALTYLEEIGDLELQVAGARRGFRLKRRLTGGETVGLIETLQKRFLRREQNDIQRISLLVSMACHAGCKTNYLLSYFGEDRPENCGHCEYCLAGQKETVEWGGVLRRTAITIIPTCEEQMQAVIGESHDALRSPRQQAKFFCGLRSPQTTRAGLHRHGAFGMLADMPFQDVFSHLEG